MKKLLLIILLFCFCRCSVDDCVVITRKENNGAIPSGAVTEEVFNQYEVGDTYCRD